MLQIQVAFYDANGRELQAFEYSNDNDAHDFSSCSFNPSGDTAVVGAFNRFYVYSFSSSKGIWEEVAVKQVGSSTSPAVPNGSSSAYEPQKPCANIP